jgi:hypothetical protein
LIREILADKAATQHKLKFFENGATPNHRRHARPSSRRNVRAWVDASWRTSTRACERLPTMYLGGGADATVVGADMKQLDFKVVQGAGETRIAAAPASPR